MTASPAGEVVKDQAARQIKEDATFKKATKSITSKANGRGGEASAKAALKTLSKALDQISSAAKKINP